MARLIALLVLIAGVAAIKQTASEESQKGVSPIVWCVVGAAVFVAVVGAASRLYANRSGYKTFGDKSGLSTSSSDIASSETGSTDRELKSRMERFEKRLEDHKKMLETRDPEAGSSSITDSESKLSSSVGGGKPMWFNKK